MSNPALQARRIADELVPVIEARLASQRSAAAHHDRLALSSAEKVADAVDRLEQVRFQPGERGARLALEKAAKTLRDQVRRRRSQHG